MEPSRRASDRTEAVLVSERLVVVSERLGRIEAAETTEAAKLDVIVHQQAEQIRLLQSLVELAQRREDREIEALRAEVDRRAAEEKAQRDERRETRVALRDRLLIPFGAAVVTGLTSLGGAVAAWAAGWFGGGDK